MSAAPPATGPGAAPDAGDRAPIPAHRPDLGPARGRFSALGLVFDSDIVAPWMEPAPAGAPADVTVRIAPVPPAPEAAPVAGVWRLTGPGEMVQEASFMRIRITDGRRVELDLSRAAGTSRETIALALGYGVTPGLLHQRGALPLHAAAAAGPLGAALFVGDAGAGKSTFAAMLARSGWALAGDDLIALDLDEDRPIGVHRAMRTARLFEDSAQALARIDAPDPSSGLSPGLSPVHAPDPRPYLDRAPSRGVSEITGAGEGLGKGVRALAYADAALGGFAWPVPLRAVFALEWLHPDDAAPELERIGGMQALMRLRDAVGRPEVASALGRDPAYFAQLGRIAAQAPVYALRRPRRFDAAPAAAALARAAMEEAAARAAAKETSA